MGIDVAFGLYLHFIYIPISYAARIASAAASSGLCSGARFGSGLLVWSVTSK